MERGLAIAVMFGIAGCCYEGMANKTVVDYIIDGDAVNAAKVAKYPVNVPMLEPEVAEIRNAERFTQLFPLMFDEAMRNDLRKKQESGAGWNFENWQGKCWGDGEFWISERGMTVNMVSDTMYGVWKDRHEADLAALAPEFRTGVARAAYYFESEDGKWFGRVDAMGEERKDRKWYDSYRVLLFKTSQAACEMPVLVMSDGMRVENGSIEAADGSWRFCHGEIVTGEMPAMELELKAGGTNEIIRLKHSSWPPATAKNCARQ